MDFLYSILHAITSFLNAIYAILFFPSKRGRTPNIDDPLLLLPAIQISEKIKNGQLTCETIIRAYLKRIEKCNPIINSYVDVNHDAINVAKNLDERIALERKGILPENGVSLLSLPLLGVPFSIKDSVLVKGLHITAGLKSRADCISDKDAEVVVNVKAVGGIPIGLTNVPELLLWFDCNNRLYGSTCNPYDLSYIPGGSSGGEAAAISSAASVVGIGSDIGGSCRIPAALCGVYGHKTTGGIISSAGKYPPVEDLDNLLFAFGPMCRYACDIIPFLKAMAGKNISKLPRIDEKIDISKLKIYYVDKVNDPTKSTTSREISERILSVVKYLETTYQVQCEKVDLDITRNSKRLYTGTLLSIKKNFHCYEMTNRQGELNPFFELIRYFFCASSHTLPTILYACWEKLFKKRIVANIKNIVEEREKMKKDFNEMLGFNGVLLFPSFPVINFKRGNTLLKHNDIFFMSVFNLLSVPVTQCPLGLSSQGLPLGVQIVTTPYNDQYTIALANELEKAFGGWESPAKIDC